VSQFLEIPEVVFEIECEEHLDVEDEPDDEGVEVELVGDGEHTHRLATLQVELVNVVYEV
jgi:hypothetical protein